MTVCVCSGVGLRPYRCNKAGSVIGVVRGGGDGLRHCVCVCVYTGLRPYRRERCDKAGGVSSLIRGWEDKAVTLCAPQTGSVSAVVRGGGDGLRLCVCRCTSVQVRAV